MPSPVVWGLGVTGGALLAVVVSPYVPGWGVALAAPSAILLFAIGAWVAPDDALVATVLRVSTAITLGFTAATVPITLSWLDGRADARTLLLEEATGAADARRTLLEMWAVMAAGAAVGIAGAILRHRRARRT